MDLKSEPIVPQIGMTLGEFFKKDLYVTTWSDTLQEEIAFVSHDGIAKLHQNDGRIQYTAWELRRLRDLSLNKDELRCVHKIKKLFGGYIVQTKRSQDEPVQEAVDKAPQKK